MVLANLRIIKRILELKQEQWLDRDALERIQMERLRGVLSATARTRHYGALMDNRADGTSLESFSITEKDAVKRDPDSFLTNPSEKPSLRSGRTSGSTGQSVMLYFSEDCHLLRLATFIWTQIEAGRTPFDVLCAFTSGCPYRKVSISSKAGLYRAIHLHMTTDDNENLAALQRYKPDIVSAYPTMMEILAKLSHNKSLRFKTFLSGGEVLTPQSRRNIEDAFSCEAFNMYGCREFGQIAWECPEEHNLHVHSSCMLEIVDSNGKPKRSGDGEVVITGLQNLAMPLIRYRLGDIACWGKECSCGRGLPVLKSFKGRSDDLIVLPSGTVRHAFSYNLAHRTGIVDFTLKNQLVQEREDLFVFRYVPYGAGVTESIREDIRELVREASLGEKVDVEFEEVDDIPKGRTGKLQRIVSKVKHGLRF
jgi:phenylacetate-CoA ligase